VRKIVEAGTALSDWIVYELAGYQTGRLILLGLSFGRVRVEPWMPRNAARPVMVRGQPVASAAFATVVGLAYWLTLTLGMVFAANHGSQ
jgi:hypothetical protein